MIIEKDVKVKDFKDYGSINITDKNLKRFVGQKIRAKLEVRDDCNE